MRFHLIFTQVRDWHQNDIRVLFGDQSHADLELSEVAAIIASGQLTQPCITWLLEAIYTEGTNHEREEWR